MIDRTTQQILNKFSNKYDYKVIINEGLGSVLLCKDGKKVELDYNSEDKLLMVKGKEIPTNKAYKELEKITNESGTVVVTKKTIIFTILGAISSAIGLILYTKSVIDMLTLFVVAIIFFAIGFIF